MIAAFLAAAPFAFALDTTPPTIPTGLSAVPTSFSQINLSWTGSTDDVGVAGYGVFRNGLQVGTTSATTYSDTGLSTGTAYSYAVNAFDAAGNLSTQSASISTSTLADVTAPSIPAGQIATAVSPSQINISWTTSTDNVGVTGYRVYRNGVQIGTTPATSYSDSGLSASTAYSYTVAAYDAAGNVSAQSGSVSATTLATGSATVSTTSSAYSVPPTIQIGSDGNILIHGLTVTSVGTNTFTGTVWGITYTVNYNGTASANYARGGRFQFLLRGGNSASINGSQIQVGDVIGVQGTVTQASPTAIQAQTVRDYSITVTRSQAASNLNNASSSISDMNSISSLEALLKQLMSQYKNLKGNNGRGR